MRISDEGEWIKVGALARETGLTVRALHHYEEVGLLVPAERTTAGHRLYGVHEVRRLHQIVSLRQLGLSLDEIREALDRPGQTLESVLELQVRRLRERIAHEETLCQRLEEMLARLRRDERDVGLGELARSVGETLRMERYFTAEQLASLEERAREMGSEALDAGQASWAELFEEFARAMKRGMPVDHPEVEAMAARARGLVQAFTGGDPALADSVRRLYRDEGPDRVLGQHGMSLPPGVWEYAQKAMAALEKD